MMRLLKQILIYFVCVMVSIYSVYADEQPVISLDVSKQFETIKNTLDKKNIPYDDLIQYENDLRDIKRQSTDNISNANQLLITQKDLLRALGDAPDTTKGQSETPEIAQQRQDINDKIQYIEGEIKNSQLNIARSEEILDLINKYNQNIIRAKLLAYNPIFYDFDILFETITQTQAYFSSIEYFIKPIMVSVFLLILCGFAWSFKKRGQNYLMNQGYDIYKPLSVRLMLQIIISAFFIIVFRFHIMDTENYLLMRALFQMVFSIILSLSLFELLGLFAFKYYENNSPSGQYVKYTDLQNKIRLILRYICCLTPVIAVIGYTELSAFIALNILGSMIAVIFFIFSRKMIVTTSQFLKQKSHFIGGNQNDDEISPLAVIIFEPVIALLSAGIILFFWGVTSQDFNLWLEEYKNGITIGQMTLNFKNLFSAVISLFLIIGLTKIIQWFLGRRVFKHTSLDIGLQNTIITIIGYGGIIMAFLSASGTLGIDMANFAIVAGALSVGIGFGLQTIFNNFISGLILLFERPFKVGDLVRVGMNEGIIKKIKVRSTELETGANQSLIVPNSMMISDTVSNWTLHNKTGRCEIRVGVAYNSDTELVKKVLLESVEHHTDILSSPPPMVLFIDFAESSLNFELRFFIIDIGEKTRISSEVRFKIDALFRTYNISLPFPQRDIHIHTKDEKNI